MNDIMEYPTCEKKLDVLMILWQKDGSFSKDSFLLHFNFLNVKRSSFCLFDVAYRYVLHSAHYTEEYSQ